MSLQGGDGRKSKSLLGQLNDAAPVRPVNNLVPLERYCMSAKLLQRQANAYRKRQNVEQLYVFLIRYVRCVGMWRREKWRNHESSMIYIATWGS